MIILVLGESMDGGKTCSIKVVEDTRYTSKQFLLDHPRGSYTTARTIEQRSIFDLEGHVSRLGRYRDTNTNNMK